jgi:hypothetical protein
MSVHSVLLLQMLSYFNSFIPLVNKITFMLMMEHKFKDILSTCSSLLAHK